MNVETPAAPQIRIVLSRPSHPGNVGATARAMKTMALSELWLVAPAVPPGPEAVAMASGADDVLAAARTVATLDEAVADCGLVLGTTARQRSEYYWPVHTAREAAARLRRLDPGTRAAVVFGTERTGLTNEELDLCHGLVHIPANPAYESLNLAQAVQVVTYEIYVAADLPARVPEREAPLATAGELEGLYRHLEATLTATGFTDRRGGPHLMRRFKRIFGRAALDQLEVNILRGLLAAAQASRRRPEPEQPE
jgi:tRNA (cytidine32/uridine32-2'-O)-methyltransferase